MSRELRAAPYCHCFEQRSHVSWTQLSGCSCGEEGDQMDFAWEAASAAQPVSSVVLSEHGRQVTFHPVYSSGTAVVRSHAPLRPNYQYYWEVKMLTDVYGTDIMVGIGTDKVNVVDCQHKFSSLLGEDSESYGLSYTGKVQHGGAVVKDLAGFCKGSLVGVRADLWSGTLEFFINRKPQGIMFTDLRRHKGPLYPMLCSTAAQSSIRLTCTTSWPASLLMDSARCLRATLGERSVRIPPGLWDRLQGQFWSLLPADSCLDDGESQQSRDMETMEVAPSVKLSSSTLDANAEDPSHKPESHLAESGATGDGGPQSERRGHDSGALSEPNCVTMSELLRAGDVNGFYVDSVEREFRIVVRE